MIRRNVVPSYTFSNVCRQIKLFFAFAGLLLAIDLLMSILLGVMASTSFAVLVAQMYAHSRAEAGAEHPLCASTRTLPPGRRPAGTGLPTSQGIGFLDADLIHAALPRRLPSSLYEFIERRWDSAGRDESSFQVNLSRKRK